MTPRTFKNICAQGDILIRRVADAVIPQDAKKVELEEGNLIVTHSETGHHHAFCDVKTRGSKPAVELFQLPDDIMECLLVVNEPSTLEHLRSFDTHEPIAFDQGTYKVTRQREYTPEGWRRVED